MREGSTDMQIERKKVFKGMRKENLPEMKNLEIENTLLNLGRKKVE